MAEKMTPREAACAQLDPCPFCGHDLHADDPFDALYPVTRDGKVWGVHCTVSNGGCDASMLCDGVDSAAAAWNRRAHLAQPAQAVDVVAIKTLLELVEDEHGGGHTEADCRYCVAVNTITRAIGNAQADGSNGTG